MNKNYIFLLMLLTFGLGSCVKTPVACFEPSAGPYVRVNSEIEFNGTCSENAREYSWNFGDGTTATGAVVQHKFNSEGTFKISLVIKNYGKTDSVDTNFFVQK